MDARQGTPVYASYKDIPGISQDEIDAVEAFRSSGRTFVYGMTLSSECFEDRNGMGGYAVLFCRWLTDLFGVEFTPVIYEWGELLQGLESGAVDFTGEMTITPERLNQYYMTSVIAERPVTITRLTDAQEPHLISARRRPRLGFLEGSSTRAMTRPLLPYDFNTVYVADSEEAYAMLREGIIDAFVEEGYEAETVMSGDLTMAEILPHIYSSITMAARRTELAPVISVVQRYLDQGGLYHLVNLYNRGHSQYLTYRFHRSLSAEEMAYVEARDGIGGKAVPIPVALENANYPVSFYNKTERAWQGIAWDVLKEIEKITALRFEVASGRDDTFLDNLDQLESGRAALVSELLQTDERKGRFLWSPEPYSRDNFALLSKLETPDLGVNEILYARVALIQGTAYEELFHRWFPNHRNTVEYPVMTAALDALRKGEVDLLMGTRSTLLTLTNYMEEPGYKANMIFYRTANSHFGFNREEELLCSIMGKAQALVNTGLLESRWLSRVFDYRSAIVRARQPYLIMFSVLMGLVVFLLIVLLQKYRESGRELEEMVRRRTLELEDRNRELEVQKNAVHAAYKVKSRFLANMSHEIRTPLNAIIGLSQTELEKAQRGSSENLESINRSGSTLLSVVNDLLDISSIESGEMELRTADYSLPALIHSAMTAARLRLEGRQISLRLELDEKLPVKLHGDKQRITQILNNLLSNAIKFTEQGSVILRIGFDRAGKNAPGDLLLIFEVHDTGIGIRDEDVKRIFTEYGQTGTSGAGMGLFVTKKLAELMDGGIGVVSEYGRGSVFTARFRQGIADQTPLGNEAAERLRNCTWKEAEVKRPLLPYARVLVVDDVPTNHAVARGIMKPYRMTVDAVSCGQDAVDIIARAEVRYDAIFMDHMMPGMDGMEAAERIRALGTEYAASVPIIALTANALPGNDELFLKHGFNAFMAKPIDINVLNKVLIEWVWDEEKEKRSAAATMEGAGEESEEAGEQAEPGKLAAVTIDGVDLAAGAAQFGGEDSYLEIVKVFIHDTPRLLETVQNCLDSFRIMPAAAAQALEALKSYTITVHGIKGSCYGICAAPVGDMAKELELAAKAQDLGKVITLNNRFIQETEKLVEELKVLFPARQEKPRLEKTNPDPALLQKLLDGARAYDINEMLSVLDELEQYYYLENNDLVEQLREAAHDYEYASVIRLLTAFLESEDEFLSGTAG
ncbi:MAG: transporter substrate-binding domain-containing protein [Treponema sp.]|nr:transporter substrate-binding domain-containing protein [Treponema sp.]